MLSDGASNRYLSQWAIFTLHPTSFMRYGVACVFHLYSSPPRICLRWAATSGPTSFRSLPPIMLPSSRAVCEARTTCGMPMLEAYTTCKVAIWQAPHPRFRRASAVLDPESTCLRYGRCRISRRLVDQVPFACFTRFRFSRTRPSRSCVQNVLTESPYNRSWTRWHLSTKLPHPTSGLCRAVRAICLFSA